MVGILETVWDKIGLRKTFGDIAIANNLPQEYERALLAMTTNRLCTPADYYRYVKKI